MCLKVINISDKLSAEWAWIKLCLFKPITHIGDPVSFLCCCCCSQGILKWQPHCCSQPCLCNRSYSGHCSFLILLPTHCSVDVNWNCLLGRLTGPVGGLNYLFCICLVSHHQRTPNATQTSVLPGDSCGVIPKWFTFSWLTLDHRLSAGAHLSVLLTQGQIWRRVNWAQVQHSPSVPVGCLLFPLFSAPSCGIKTKSDYHVV